MFKFLPENRNFNFLFIAQVVSQIGDSMYTIGLLWLVLELTGSNSTMGIVAMVSYLPMLIFGVFAGILVDTYDRKKLMVSADIFRGLVVLVLPVTYFLGVINIGVIFCVSFVLATFSTVFNPARDAFVPDIVDKAKLLKANSIIQSTNFAAILLGPAIAGGLIGTVGVAHLFSFDALTFFISLAALLFIRYKNINPIKSGAVEFKEHFFEIMRFVRQHKKLRFLLGLTAINNFFIMGPAIVGTPIFVREILHKDAISYAFVESCLGLGMVLGAILINYHNRILNKGRLLILGLIFDGVTYMLAYWCESLPLFMALIAFHALGIPYIVVTRISMIQEWVDSKQLGRVFSLLNMSVVGMTALTTGVTGWLADLVPINVIFGVFGFLGMMCGLVSFFYKELRES